MTDNLIINKTGKMSGWDAEMLPHAHMKKSFSFVHPSRFAGEIAGELKKVF